MDTFKDSSDINRQDPICIIYVGINSSSSLLYQSETTSSSNNVTVTLEDLNNVINVSACNLSAILFYVSAKFDEIGEGNVSSRKGFDRRDAESICRTGKYQEHMSQRRSV